MPQYVLKDEGGLNKQFLYKKSGHSTHAALTPIAMIPNSCSALATTSYNDTDGTGGRVSMTIMLDLSRCRWLLTITI